LTILFDKTLHNGFFGKLPFGSKDEFVKMTITTLQLVVLMWLLQLEEYFYKIGDTNKSGWNAHGKYCPVKDRNMSKEFPLDNIHMIKANSTAVTKITYVQWIKLDIKKTKKLLNPLKNGQQKSCVGTTITSKTKQMQMTKQRNALIELKHLGQIDMLCQKRSYKPINQDARNNVNIVNFTPQQQRQKTPDQ
jgi:hypothetical protein